MKSDLNPTTSIEPLVAMVQNFARARAESMARGAETPRLAALLLQQYGRGVVDATASLFDDPRAADPIYRALCTETMKIDPRWQEHERERWAGRPADVVAQV